MMRGTISVAGVLLGLVLAGPAVAEFSKVSDRASFVQLVQGKTLTRPLVKLRVAPDGSISGKGARWDVTGNWRWQNGYFCRDLNWGGDELGYNCQEVRANGNRIRFTSDQGNGDSADFKLR
ncbi:dihydrodipicolinate reductase [Thalassococcus lentus]|uniref:Dihydrodipicolinate reductase n=1 Tax=Thalassococcus lentus TaxID=1210524 RepID=A0ABT4XWU0_9RHOB|nr:dihydrodipicolinate reductase [Thalassococcus lentus]MDA7426445.1 dihydrodipicolinate reductase [Thalassococcus lentus]